MSIGSSAQKGGCDTSISKIRMPKAHQSTARLWPLFVMISGAKYSGVPHNVHVLSVICFAKPKSTTFK